MNRTGRKRIEKCTNREALSILTEGYATLEEGLQIFDRIARSPVALISEGKNSAYISMMLDHWDIADVEVILGAEDRTGKKQLKVLYDFFTAVNHEKPVIIVWDCDANEYRNLEEHNNTVPFVFEQNISNTVCSRGVENLFPEDLFADYLKIETNSFGEVNRKFDEVRKSDFLQHIANRNQKDDFSLFEPLADLINVSRNSGN